MRQAKLRQLSGKIKTENNRVVVKCEYDPAACDWDEAVVAELPSFGLKQGQAEISALPYPHPTGAVLFFTMKNNTGAGQLGIIIVKDSPY